MDCREMNTQLSLTLLQDNKCYARSFVGTFIRRHHFKHCPVSGTLKKQPHMFLGTAKHYYLRRHSLYPPFPSICQRNDILSGFAFCATLPGLSTSMPAFQAKPFRRTPTASSSLGERLGALYRSKLKRYPF